MATSSSWWGWGPLQGVGCGMAAYSANPAMLRGMMRHGAARMQRITTRGGQHVNGGIIVVAQSTHLGQIAHGLAHVLGGVVGGQRSVPVLYDTVLKGKVGPPTHESFPKFAVSMGPWGVMSRHLLGRDLPPPMMSSFTRLRMGWIGEEQVVEVPRGEGWAVTLRPMGGGQGRLVIRIPGRRGTYYLLENRQTVPGDPVLPGQGLPLLRVGESKEDGDDIVRVEDANSRVPDFQAAAFGPGPTPSAQLARDVAVSNARADLAAVKNLLIQMKVSEVRAKLEHVSQP